MLDLDDRLDELKQLGLYRRTRMVSRATGSAGGARRAAGARAVLGQQPGAGRSSARARGGGGRGDALGRRRGRVARRVGDDDAAPPARGAAGAASCGRDAGVVFGSGSLANMGVIPALARKGEVVFHDELAHPSIADGCRLAGADAFAYRHCRSRAPRLGPARVRRPRRADRHRRRVRARRRRRAAGGHRRARAPLRRPRAGRRGAVDRRRRPGRPRRSSPRPASRTRSTSSPAPWARRSGPTAASPAATT